MSVKRQVNNTLNLYVESAREASLGFVRNWTVLVGCVGAYFTFQLMSILVSPLGMVGGFILGAVLLALLSFYYSWVRETVLGRKLSLQSLVDFDSALFFNLMSVAFLLWIFDGLILEPLVMSTHNEGLYRGLKMLIFLAFNPLAETVYQKGLESVEAFRYSLSFTKEHFIEWYLPLLVLVAPIILRLPVLVLLVFVDTNIMSPGLVVLSSWRVLLETEGWPVVILGLLTSHWFTLFRCHLFIGLDSGKHRRLY